MYPKGTSFGAPTRLIFGHALISNENPNFEIASIKTAVV